MSNFVVYIKLLGSKQWHISGKYRKNNAFFGEKNKNEKSLFFLNLVVDLCVAGGLYTPTTRAARRWR